jgi:hypothetical protein
VRQHGACSKALSYLRKHSTHNTPPLSPPEHASTSARISLDVPQYNPGTRPNRTTVEPAGVNLFAKSYGGTYGPTFVDFFEDQNDRRKNSTLSNNTLEDQLESLVIINGVVDVLSETISVANVTHNNTYDIAAIDLLTYRNDESALASDEMN